MAVLTVTDTNSAANATKEGTALAGTGVDLNATGGTGPYFWSISGTPFPGAFAIDADGIITVLDGLLIDYEALVNGQLVLTIHVEDSGSTVSFTDVQVIINVANLVGSTINGTAGADVIDKSFLPLGTTDEEDTIFGQADNDVIDAFGGADIIDGGAGEDDIDGGAGNDIIKGGADKDTIVGGDGDDDIDGGASATGDVLDGGDGLDTLRYSTSSAAVTVDLLAGTFDGGDATLDTAINFENVVGSSQADEIKGNKFDNLIEGGGGADELDGDSSDLMVDVEFGDTVSYANSSSGVTVTLGKNGVTTTAKGGDAEGDKLTNFENILGSAFADTLTLTEIGNIEGGAGADILTGSSGDADSISYLASNAAVTITLGAAGKQATGVGGHAQGDKFSGFEQVAGSNFNDSITGNELDNALLGGLGNDTLTGGAGDDFLFGDNVVFFAGFGKIDQGGNDTLSGGLGNDFIQGGIGSDNINGNEGTDTASYESSAAAVTIVLGTKGAVAQMQGGDAAGDKLQLIENIIGSANDDKITGNDLDNIIEGGAGVDILDGGAGSNDTVAYFNSPDVGGGVGVVVNLALVGPVEQATVVGSDASKDQLKGFENVIGSFFDDVLDGDSAANVIEGGGGADTLFGGLGDDLVSYENFERFDDLTAGVDVFLDNSGDLKVNVGSNGTDAEGDTGTEFQGLRGSGYDDILTGNNLANTIQGLAGDDLIAGNEGVDTLDGGAGKDTVSFFGSGSGVTVTLGVGTAVTTVAGGTFGADKISNFENIIGTAFVDTLTGNALDNIFDGNNGQDVINGGAGNDTVDYSWAASGVVVTLGVSGAQTTVTGGDTDKISLIENIIGTASDDEINGNALANKLEGGAGKDEITGGAGIDIILGDAGDDTIVIAGTDAQSDTIDGGADNDEIIVGGVIALTLENFDAKASSIEDWAGNGFSVLGTAKSNIFDFSYLTTLTGITFVDGGAGNDTIKAHASVGMDLRGGLGEDSLFGSSVVDKLDGGDNDDDLFGGAGNDTLKGGAGSDSIYGEGDNDTITGGAGNDFLDGGLGDDIYVVSGTEGQFDIIKDAGGAADKIEVQGVTAITLSVFDAGFAGIELWQGNNTGILGDASENELNFSGITATGINFIDGAAGDDFITATSSGSDLRGGLGDDKLVGGAGQDLLNGGAGDDNLNGAAGNDTIYFTGLESQFDTVNGGANTDKIQVVGTVAVTLNKFDAGASSIEEWSGVIGSTQGVVGNASDNVLNFAALTNVQNLPFVDGAAGEDTLTGHNFGADLRGGVGDDILIGGTGADTLNGNVGEDVINGDAGNDKIQINGAEAEFDVIDGGADNDTVVALGAVAVTLSAFNATASSIENWAGNKQAIQGNANDNVLDFSGVTSNFTDVPFINGAAGNDTITGTIYADDLRGGLGKDTLNGGVGADKLDGGDGIDILNGGADNDILVGGIGNDTLNGDGADDTLNGSAGTDVYDLGLGIDIFQISGTEAQFDTFDGNGATSLNVLGTIAVTLNTFDAGPSGIATWNGNGKGVLGDATNNTLDFADLITPSNIGIIDGAAGNDTITGSKIADDIRGGTGNDNLNGSDGADILNGGIGTDVLEGGSGNDKFVISAAEGQFDTITDSAGTSDTISFVGATVTLDKFDATASGIEIWDGKSAAIVGNAGANNFDLSGLTTVTLYKSIDGGAGDDTITGVNLSDVADDLRGGTGTDVLTGGKGNDKLTGGSGSDTFVFDAVDFGKDTIVDFSSSGFDILDFDGVFGTDQDVIDAATQVGVNVVITYDDQNTVTLNNFTLAQLEALDAARILT